MQQTDRLFISEGGNGSIHDMAKRMVAIVRKLNPKVVSAHHLRASVIVKWVRAHNLREAQYKAEHRYSSTEKYLQDDIEAFQKEINTYHPLG